MHIVMTNMNLPRSVRKFRSLNSHWAGILGRHKILHVFEVNPSDNITLTLVPPRAIS